MIENLGRWYIENAKRTESRDMDAIRARLDEKTIRLLHAGMGLTTESGEFVDALKKWIFYGKPLDDVNLKEEIGDHFWYAAIGADALGVLDLEEIMGPNIAKLRARYPDAFQERDAIKRDLAKERAVLEGQGPPDLRFQDSDDPMEID